MQRLAQIRHEYRTSGFKGLLRKLGWPAAIALFTFFLVKGLVWLVIIYGGWELISQWIG